VCMNPFVHLSFCRKNSPNDTAACPLFQIALELHLVVEFRKHHSELKMKCVEMPNASYTERYVKYLFSFSGYRPNS
ncbi:hypothetical protein KJ656_14450, partial [bacterium]|nr:hypothetical protein [bacterium]